jgi:hypothetical protein
MLPLVQRLSSGLVPVLHESCLVKALPNDSLLVVFAGCPRKAPRRSQQAVAALALATLQGSAWQYGGR